MDDRRQVAFVFVGGMHQALHIAPVAAALHASGAAQVEAFVLDEDATPKLTEMFVALGAGGIPIVVMKLPPPVAALASCSGRFKTMKLPKLLYWQRRLRRFDAIVTAERTTTILKRLPGRQPLLVHIPHGAGDRAKGFEPRLGLFDEVITAGEKDRRRMVAEGLVRPEHCHAAGYIKLAAVERLSPVPDIGAPLSRERPTILYNPHFARKMSSWTRFGEALADRIIAEGRYNLIVAPHVRLQERLSAEEANAWRRKAVPGRVTVDLGSWRSLDMSYTRAADLYIGDVSSQIYEYLVTPKPCLFLDAHGVNWRGNPDYAMWGFGEVCTSVDAAMAAIGTAAARHGEFADIQRAAVADALGDTGARAPHLAALWIMARLAGATEVPVEVGSGVPDISSAAIR
ncbi:glycosyl transferase [Rhizorhabdus argentea]|uniref:glycosyl transferase n=1 Tax=Rhizorhabdus argentea TaxID=1387174 RepID=UPI0030ED4FE6